jgi:hypothetical protein
VAMLPWLCWKSIPLVFDDLDAVLLLGCHVDLQDRTQSGVGIVCNELQALFGVRKSAYANDELGWITDECVERLGA